MITKKDKSGYRELLPGIHMKPLVWHDRMLMVEFFLQKDAQVPLHDHPNEQCGYLISGHMRLSIAGMAHDILPGDSYSIPEGIKHQAEIIKDSVVIDVFTPIREDYLPDNTL